MIGLAISLMVELVVLMMRLTIMAVQLMITGIVLLAGLVAREIESRQ